MTLTPEAAASPSAATQPPTQDETIASLGRYEYGWADTDVAGSAARRGLSEDVVRDISAKKNEPDWMLQARLRAYRTFMKKPMPNWGPDLSGIDFDNIKYFVRSTEKQAESWDDLPDDIRNTYDRLGIPEAEKARFIGGVAAQYECLAGQTLVWTANRGQVPIKDIHPGDQVFAYDESRERFVVAAVKGSAQTDTRLTYQVTTTRRSIRATDNHPMLVLREESEPASPGARYAKRWVTVGELQAGDCIAAPRSMPEFGAAQQLPQVAGLDSLQRSSVELMRLLGLFLAAGTVESAGRVHFAIPHTDLTLRSELSRNLDALFGLQCNAAGDSGVVVQDRAFSEWIAASGCGGLALANRVPDWVYRLPADQRLALLGGWADAAASSSSAALLDQTRELAELCGLPADAPGSALDSQLDVEVVTGIDAYEVEPVYDIEVDGPHNFIAEGLVVHNSEVVYHKIREDLEAQGVIFLDTDTALKEHEELFRENFASVIPAGDNKFSALNTAVWSGGSFIYVPKGVHVDIPLQAYFRINTENMGQFERTLIIADEDSYVHYIEGCTAPVYSSDSLHSAVVEIVVKPRARVRYTTIQNWSVNVYNLVTKRARAEAGATMEWVDGNIGSKVTMKYPAVWMTGEHAKGEVLSVAFAGESQHQDTGAKMLHLAPSTSSNIVSKSVARGGGRSSYRGLVEIHKDAHGSKSSVKCDALLVDDVSRSDTYPYVDIREDDVTVGHEATVSKVSENQLFYLMSRGLTEDEAMAMVVRGFIEPIAKELPMEYALELNKLIQLQMEGAVG